jgi:putative CocE/NonD family hydrolase
VDKGTVKNGVLTQGDMAFSADAMMDDPKVATAFLDRFVKGEGTFDEPRARVYVTGVNRWRELAQYPPAGDLRSLYLHSAGKANTSGGDGRLDFTVPGEEPADAFTYDPARPVPTHDDDLGTDQRALEARDDVLVYTSAVLDRPLTIMGRVRVELHAATDGRDTDFTARLIDVAPDGKAVKLGPMSTGIIRARYRLGYEQERLLTPGQVERYSVDLHDIGHTFLAGHRIRLDVSSSAYPSVAPNPNTGNPVATDTESRVARQQVHHRGEAASRVVMPVVPD